MIFKEATADRSLAERHYLARRISIYTAFILIGSMWIGGFVLAFFGISLGALRIAGGLVVTVSAWGLLMEPQRHEDRKVADAAPTHGDPEDVAFFPLTMPLTTGPGTIAIAIALSSQQPTDDIGRLSYSAGASVAALVIAAMVWVSYGWSDQVVAMLGARGARIVSRLAFDAALRRDPDHQRRCHELGVDILSPIAAWIIWPTTVVRGRAEQLAGQHLQPDRD